MTVYYCVECVKHEYVIDGKEGYAPYRCGCDAFSDSDEVIDAE